MPTMNWNLRNLKSPQRFLALPKEGPITNVLNIVSLIRLNHTTLIRRSNGFRKYFQFFCKICISSREQIGTRFLAYANLWGQIEERIPSDPIL